MCLRSEHLDIMILEKQKAFINFAINEFSISVDQAIFIVVVVLIVLT